MEAQTLMLSQSYEPQAVIPWSHAVQLLFLGKVEVIEEYEQDARSTYLVIKIPAVVRLLGRVRRRKSPVRFSRVNIYARDGYKCQYCGERRPNDDLTFDHVTPRSRGGTTTWTNIVTCCTTCNGTKRNRTPAEAGMRLLKQPVEPRTAPAVVLRISKQHAPAQWGAYLYWTAALDQD